jgi:hypothetical protein
LEPRLAWPLVHCKPLQSALGIWQQHAKALLVSDDLIVKQVEALDRMTQAAAKFNPDKIKMDDLAKSGGIPDEAE